MDKERAFRLIRELRAALHLKEHQPDDVPREKADALVDEAEAFLIEHGESDWVYDDE